MAKIEVEVEKSRKNQKEVEAFFDGWALYRKILQEDYMFHRDIYQHVREQLGTYQETGALLDLGCGDAAYIAGVLETLPPKAYTGVDLSQVALDEARQNLAHINVDKHFQQQDLLGYLEGCQQGFDVILASYSVHHLSLEDKQRFFEYCRRILSSEGRLLFIDESRYADETRDAYLQRWWVYMERECPKLTAEEKQFIRAHMANSDFPESFENHYDMALNANFTACQEVYCDPQHLHRFLVCSV